MKRLTIKIRDEKSIPWLEYFDVLDIWSFPWPKDWGECD